jgi:uncharacterized protein (DUF1499 family)
MRERIGIAAVALMIVGPALAWLRVVPGLGGFIPYALGGLLAVGVGLATVVQGVRGQGVGMGGAAALIAGVAFVAVAARGRGAPRINDFTTDLADPPAFRHAATLPANAGRDLAYPASFAPIQQACCADLRPAHLHVAPAEAFTRARDVATSMPAWTITDADPGTGMIEAVATTRLFGFQDDVAIRVRPDGPAGSRIDVRSKSRDGKGDLGTNAARIRTYVHALEADQ